MKRGIIPNRLIILGICVGFVCEYVSAGWTGVITAVLRCTVTIVVLFILFVTRAMGAGDIKLYSLISIYMGLIRGIWVFSVSVLIAGFYIIISTIIRFNSINVVHILASTVSNFVMSGNYKKNNRTSYGLMKVHTIKMTPFILGAVVLVLIL